MVLNWKFQLLTEVRKISVKEVERSKWLSRVRIHVECFIGLLKQKHKVMEDPLTVNLIKSKGDEDYAIIDKIVTFVLP